MIFISKNFMFLLTEKKILEYHRKVRIADMLVKQNLEHP